MYEIKDDARFHGTLVDSSGQQVSVEGHTHTEEITAAIDDALGGTGLTEAIDTEINTQLMTDGVIKASLIPGIALTQCYPVNTQAEMLALTVEAGDVGVVIDDNQTYMFVGGDSTDISNWILLRATAAAGASTDGHTHTISEVIGLEARLATIEETLYADLFDYVNTMNGTEPETYAEDFATFLAIMNGTGGS